MFSKKSIPKKPSSPPRPKSKPPPKKPVQPPPKKPSPSPPRPQAPPRKIPEQLQHFRPTKMTGQLVAVKPPPRPTTGPTKTPTKTPPPKTPKTPSPPRPQEPPKKIPDQLHHMRPSKMTGQLVAVNPPPKKSIWDLFKEAKNKTPPPPKPTVGPVVKPTTQWSTFDNISLNEIRGYAQQYKNKSNQDIYNILIKKCNPEDAKKGVCKYDVEILSRIIHSYPLGKAPSAPQVQRAPNNKTPLNSQQKSVDKKFSDLLRHIVHDYDLVYKASDIPVEQMLKRVEDLKTRLNEFKNASNDAKNTAEYKQRHAEYIMIYKYIDTNKQILKVLIELKAKAKQLHNNPKNNKLAKESIQLYKKALELNKSMPDKYKLLPHINLKFVQDCLAKNQLFVSDPIFAKLKLT